VAIGKEMGGGVLSAIGVRNSGSSVVARNTQFFVLNFCLYATQIFVLKVQGYQKVCVHLMITTHVFLASLLGAIWPLGSLLPGPWGR
jgi:hypothetical protein